MTERDFIYWLQGFLELEDPKTLNNREIKILKDHLALVMTKVTVPVTCSDVQLTSAVGIPIGPITGPIAEGLFC